MTISAELLSHYRHAFYQVSYHDRAITFRIAEQNADLALLLKEQGAENAIFLSAFNPHSQLLGDEENTARNELLELALNQTNKRYFSGYGTCSAPRVEGNGIRHSQWPKEISHLVLDVKNAEVQSWLQDFAQNAAVYVDNNGNCSLVLNELQQ